MKRIFRSRVFLVALVSVFFLSAVQCGYIMYPERNGQAKGEIDGTVLILDCLWLLVGIVPGVIALVVDFTTGCVYEPSGSVKLKPGSMFSLRLRNPAPADARLSVEFMDSGGASASLLFERDFNEGETMDAMVLDIPEDLPSGTYELAVMVNGRTSASWNLVVE